MKLSLLLVTFIFLFGVHIPDSNGQNNTLLCKDNNGAALYEEHCAPCHRPLKESERKGRSYSRIRSALKFKGVHGPVSRLTDEEIRSIACVLRNDNMRSDANPHEPNNKKEYHR